MESETNIKNLQVSMPKVTETQKDFNYYQSNNFVKEQEKNAGKKTEYSEKNKNVVYYIDQSSSHNDNKSNFNDKVSVYNVDLQEHVHHSHEQLTNKKTPSLGLYS